MLYKHYITVDSEHRIIDGYSSFERPPAAGDIYIHDGGPQFELFKNQPRLKLSFSARGVTVWQMVYDNGQPRWRTPEEIEADLPPVTPPPSVEERLDTAEYNVETLNRVLIIMMGGDPDE